MGGPSWVAAALAAVMISTAIYCAGRLAAARLWQRSTEVDADVVHVAMGVAMAGMLLPGLSPLPGAVWEAVFGVAGAWFAYQAVRSLRQGGAASGSRCSHPVPHLVESAAMVFMLAALPGSWPDRQGQAMPMSGMGGGRATAGGSAGALAVILALFMIGYVFWTADQLTALVRAPAAVTSGPVPDRASIRANAGGPDDAADMKAAAGLRRLSHQPGTLALAPRLAACYKIAMGIAMGYMLILML
jgi:Domain of unknown function (DUF5134)